jgi:hypothetical protein
VRRRHSIRFGTVPALWGLAVLIAVALIVIRVA